MEVERIKGRKAERELAEIRLTLAIDDARRDIHLSEAPFRVFGVEGVGGITSDRVCVRIDGKKADVWLAEGIYSSIQNKVRPQINESVKRALAHPDEKLLEEHTPIFKALSNCDIAIRDVSRSSLDELREVGRKLWIEHDIISSLKKGFSKEYIVKKHGADAVEEALVRYERNRIPPSETDGKASFRLQMEGVLFEKEVVQQLREMREHEVFKVLTAPDGTKASVYGNMGIGVVVASPIVVQLDGERAKVFLEKDAAAGLSLPQEAQEACEQILRNPQLVGRKLRNLPHFLKAVSESGIRVTELNVLSSREINQTATRLVEQNWIASQFLKAPESSREEVLKEIMESVKSAKRVNEAFARYGIDVAVEAAMGEERHEGLSAKIADKLSLLKYGMVDEKVNGIEIFGMSGLFAVKIKDDAMIKVRGRTASVLLSREFSSLLAEHVRSRKEFEMLKETYVDEDLLSFKHPELLEGERKLLPYLSAIKALKEHGVGEASFRLMSRRMEYYMERMRRELSIPSQFTNKLKEGSFAEVVDEMVKLIPPEELVAKLYKAGMEKEARAVELHIDALRSTRNKVRSMIGEWVERGVPERQELVASINPQLLRLLKEEIAGMEESNAKLSNRIRMWREKLSKPQYSAPASQQMLEFIREDEKAVEENKKRIEKAREALKVLEGE